MVAPSFPAAFACRPGQLLAALRRVGFAGVYEVAFGADLTSRVYRELHAHQPERRLITTPCPAVVGFVRKHAVDLLPLLAPVLSPMAAMGKLIKSRLLPGSHTFFLGPCTAKIAEAQDEEVAPWVDGVLTFQQVHRLLAQVGVDPTSMPDEEFDPPHSFLGGVFPMQGGLLRAAELPVDPAENRVSEVAGAEAFVEFSRRLCQRLREGDMAELETRIFDVLFCNGCIAGPGLDCEESLLRRKERVVGYLRTRHAQERREEWHAAMALYADVDLRRGFSADEQRQPEPTEAELRAILASTGKHQPDDELNCRACGYASCRDKATAVYHGLAELDMCLPHMVERLQSMVDRLNDSNEQLTAAQAQLLRAERLASMGQLAAGIAHEVNNPLGTILIYAHLLADTVASSTPLEGDKVATDVRMILTEAKRCKSIVSGLLDFARQNKIERSQVLLRELAEEAVRVISSQIQDDRITFVQQIPANLPPANIDHQQMLQVLINLVRNAVQAMPAGGTVTIGAAFAKGKVHLSVRDEGTGLSPEAMGKLFNPFFTTKPLGCGTGLGLPICYGIVKMHRGSISARNNEGTPGATFDIFLPDDVASSTAAIGAT